jgi:hypothetical protein
LFSYILFTRVPDFFEGEYIDGVITRASFSNGRPQLVIDYNVGSQKFHYRTNMWFLTTYNTGQKVTMIYDPSNPSEASIYALVGYWIRWPELFISAFLFVTFFITAIFITGKSEAGTVLDDPGKKRKYKD